MALTSTRLLLLLLFVLLLIIIIIIILLSDAASLHVCRANACCIRRLVRCTKPASDPAAAVVIETVPTPEPKTGECQVMPITDPTLQSIPNVCVKTPTI
jgi:hypothetical protein